MRLVQLATFGAIALATALLLVVFPATAQLSFPAAANTPGVSAALSASPPYTCVTNKYVDGINGNDSNSGTQTLPWKTIGNADNQRGNAPTPGECVNVLPGTYTLTSPIGIGPPQTGASNSATGYFVYRSTVPQGAHIIAGSSYSASGDIIFVYSGYVIIDGFEIDGNKSVSYGSGIDGCYGGGGLDNLSHHIVAINNIIHDIGGSGISTCTVDYITWRNNVVYNCASTSPYQVSGLNVYAPRALAAGSYTPTAWDNVTYGVQISYNIVHDCMEGPAVTSTHTDGNGIIVDTTYGSSSCPTCGTAYPGNILVLGNVSYNNGGGGIHTFISENITIANNTCYNNYLDKTNPATARGELSNLGGANINWINNIAIATPGTGVLANNRPVVSVPLGNGFNDSGAWTRNITFGASNISDANSNVSTSTNLVSVNPKLTSPATGNFSPLPGSPTERTGMPESYLPSRTPDIGAY